MSRSFLGSDIFRAVQLRPRGIMLFRSLQHVVMRRWFVFIIVGLAIIFAHRVIDKFVPHQNASQIRVAVEPNTIKIKNFTVFFTVRSSQSTPVAFEQKSSRSAGSMRKKRATAGACSLSIKSDDCCDGPGFGTMSILE